MCYSFKTSIISYTIGMISAIFALCTRQIVLGVLILAYTQMQLAEIFIWYGIDKQDLNINRVGNTIGKYLLATHNFAVGLGIILSIIFISKRKLTIIDFIPIIIGICFFLFILFYYYLPGKYPDVTFQLRPCKDKGCQHNGNRLKWSFPHNWYGISFIITLIISFIYLQPIFPSKIIWPLFFTCTFILSIIFFNNVIGSLWCFSTAILAPLLVCVNYFFIRNIPNNQLLI